MDKLFIPALRRIFPSVRWYGPPSAIYLTFDDGPHPAATPAVLEVLRKEGIRGTFFLVGEHARAYPEIVADIIREGHIIGNHTLTHRAIWLSRKSVLEEEIGGAQKVIEDVAGIRPTMFRPPYGRFDPRTIQYCQSLGLRTVLFSINSWDFRDRPATQVVNKVTQSAAWGDIIVFHDNHQTYQRITPYLVSTIHQLRDRGFSFAPLE